jgi:hypothetical protein
VVSPADAFPAPAPRFAHQIPAGRWSSGNPDLPVPDGQPGPAPAARAARPRWARCPVDQQLHLMTPAGVQMAAAAGYGFALCGRRLAAAALTLRGESEGLCLSCVAAGTAP